MSVNADLEVEDLVELGVVRLPLHFGLLGL